MNKKTKLVWERYGDASAAKMTLVNDVELILQVQTFANGWLCLAVINVRNQQLTIFSNVLDGRYNRRKTAKAYLVNQAYDFFSLNHMFLSRVL